VGREGELADLTRAWEGAVAGQPRLVLVAGEAGIGKTRLVEAAAELASATGGLVVQARCYEAERSLFLQPVAEAVRAAALALPPDRLAAAALEQLGWTAYYSRDHQAASELTPRLASWPSGRWPPPGPPRRRCCWPPACATPKGTWPGPGRPSTPCSASPTRPPRRPA
jgi:hypothetical protein